MEVNETDATKNDKVYSARKEQMEYVDVDSQ